MTAITVSSAPAQPKAMAIAGWTLSGLFIAFMIFDTGIKLSGLPIVAETNAQLGYPADVAMPIAIIELIATLLYAIPRTKVLGAILLTGVMGGAIATHIRVGNPLFSHILFGVYLGVMAWGGIWFRDPAVRALIPFKR